MSTSEGRDERDQPLLTAVAVVATLLVLPVLVLSDGFSSYALAGIALAAGLVAVGRDTAHPLAALLIIAMLWLAGGPDPTTPWALVLAALMLTIHASVALRSSVPPAASIGAELVRRWLRRGSLVGGATVVVYLVGIAVHNLARGHSELVVVLALCLLGGLVLLLRSETLHQQP